MANRAWRAPPAAGAEAARADELSARLQLPAPLGRALFLRGLTDEPAWRQFLAAEKAEFPEPPSPLNLRESARHLAAVCRAGGHALVHGDYDVDGICGTALLTRTLTLWGAQVTPFLPSRFAEGYGIAEAAIEKIKRQRIATLVTADCGTNHGELLDAAAASGCTVIVCDHHLLVDGQQPKTRCSSTPINPAIPRASPVTAAAPSPWNSCWRSLRNSAKLRRANR